MDRTEISLNNATKDLVESLTARSFNDPSTFEKVYGEEIYEKFAGMIPLIRSFIRAVEDKEERKNTYRCKDCRQVSELFMLNDSLWRKLSDDKKDTLCLNCCERGLERSLTIDDFNLDTPCNRVIFFAYMLGRE